jgi:hypothetical protein
MNKLSYELALELKKAGWKQPEYMEADSKSYVPVYRPSLSELIEACPVTYDYDGETLWFGLKAYPDGWRSGYETYDNCKIVTATAESREEAVARLWLKLQAQSEKQ